MTDLELIEYANKAGLCLATCWDLDELYNANAAEETERGFAIRKQRMNAKRSKPWQTSCGYGLRTK
jgi:hypothetical protein